MRSDMASLSLSLSGALECSCNGINFELNNSFKGLKIQASANSRNRVHNSITKINF
jgi:hypothetical protein